MFQGRAGFQVAGGKCGIGRQRQAGEREEDFEVFHGQRETQGELEEEEATRGAPGWVGESGSKPDLLNRQAEA